MASIAAVRKALVLILSALLGVGSALALVACGDGDPEPSLQRADAQALLDELEQVQANFEVQSCVVAESHVQSFINDVAALPDSVDSEVREALNRGALNLSELLNEQCEREIPTTPTTTEETTTEETTTEETTPTTTEETTTEETTTEEPTTTQEPDTGGDGGGGGIGVPQG